MQSSAGSVSGWSVRWWAPRLSSRARHEAPIRRASGIRVVAQLRAGPSASRAEPGVRARARRASRPAAGSAAALGCVRRAAALRGGVAARGTPPARPGGRTRSTRPASSRPAGWRRAGPCTPHSPTAYRPGQRSSARRGRWPRRPSCSAPRARPGSGRAPGRCPRPRARRRCSGSAPTSTCAHVEPDGRLARLRRSSAWIASATSSRGASSSTKRSPSRVEQVRALAAHRLGDQEAVARALAARSAVGWNCMNSRSASARARRRSASAGPAPTAPRGLVVRSQSAAMPPVASTTARASSASGPPVARGARAARRSAPRAWPARWPRAARAPRCARSWRRSADSVARDPPAGGRAAGVHDAPPRVAALEAEREVAVRSASKLDAELLEVAHARGRLLAQHAHRARARRVAAGGERVRGVLLGRVVVRQRGGDPALRPVARRLRRAASGSRARRCAPSAAATSAA